MQPLVTPSYATQQETQAEGARHITGYAFWSRWTTDERRALLTAAQASVAALDFRQMVDRAQFVDLDDELWASTMPQLAAMGILTTDRAAEILGAPVVDSELP